MAWVKFPGNRRTFNTRAIFFVGVRGNNAVICSTINRDDNSVVGVSREKAMKIIADAEREERRQHFEENKDDLVEAVLDKLKERDATLVDQVVEQIISRTHLAKPSGEPSRVKAKTPKAGG